MSQSNKTFLFAHPIQPSFDINGQTFTFSRPSARAFEIGRRIETRIRKQFILLNEQYEAIKQNQRSEAPDVYFDDADLEYIIDELSDHLLTINGTKAAEIFTPTIKQVFETEFLSGELIGIWLRYRIECAITESDKKK